MLYFQSLGKKSAGLRWEKILSSKHFQNGAFKNVNGNQMVKEGMSGFSVATQFFLDKKPFNIKPHSKIPSLKIDLFSLQDKSPVLIWLGHSSYLIKYNGLSILIDPVLDGYASPSPSLVKSFEGTDIYLPSELPDIDILIITHDHYDHLDYKTILNLGKKIKKIVVPLGVGEHLEFWNFPKERIVEMDWWESKDLFTDIKLISTPARHFSGRTIQRFQTLWSSFVLELGSYKIFIGGDSGYDDQFKKIGNLFGPFDLCILENGQYGANWPFIHMFPEETAQAAIDLKANFLFPVHWGKFILAQHSWSEPIERLLIKAKELGLKVNTPLIGQPLYLNQDLPPNEWWKTVQ